MLFITIIFTLYLIIVDVDSENKVNIIMEKDNNSFVAINYPTTNIKDVDRKIESYINSNYSNFKKEKTLDDISELNIDYVFNLLNDRYVSVTLKKYQYTSYKSNDLFAILYDNNLKKFLSIKDFVNNYDDLIGIIKKEMLNKYKNIDYNLINEVLDDDFKNYSLINIIDNNLVVYFNILLDYDFLSFSISLDNIDTNIKYNKVNNDTLNSVVKTDSVIDPNKKVIAITFDDGPSIYTSDIVNILNDNDANATFFVLGNKIDMYSNVLRSAVSNGNELANHSFNHKWLSRVSLNELKYQIDTTNEKIKSITGFYPTYLRPTYGDITKKLRNNTNMKIVLWNIDPKDWKNISPTTIANNVISKAGDGKIILLHDTHKRTVEAVKIIVPELKKQGYQLITLSEMDEVLFLRNIENN